MIFFWMTTYQCTFYNTENFKTHQGRIRAIRMGEERKKGGSSLVMNPKDNSLREFRRLCSDIAEVPGNIMMLIHSNRL